MRSVFSATCQWLLLLAGFATYSYAAQNPYAAAIAADPLGETNPRESVSGAYRSPFGTQVHEECFRQASRNSGLARVEAEARMERWIRDAVESVFPFCQKKYPELAPYIGEWISQARRAVIYCGKESKEKADYSGLNLGMNAGSVGIVGKSAARDQSDSADGVGPLGSLAKHQKAGVVLPARTLAKIFKAYGTSAQPFSAETRDTLIHEIFHSTGANFSKNGPHNRVEERKPSLKRICGRDSTQDRVSVVSSLCSGETLNSAKASAAEQLALRMDGCGMSEGCEKLFTRVKRRPIANLYSPSEGLEKSDAKSLCARIKEEGACLARRRTDGGELLKQEPHLSALGDRIRDRLNAVLSANFYALSGDLAKAYPEAFKPLLSMRESSSDKECVEAVFDFRPDGGVRIKGEAEPAYDMSEDMFNSLRLRGDGLATFNKKAYDQAQKNASCSTGSAWRIYKTLDEISAAVHVALTGLAYENAVLPRVEGTQEGTSLALMEEPIGREALRSLLGKELEEEYFLALGKYHPASARFDCVASECATVKDGLKAAEKLNGSFPALKCESKP